MLRVQCFHSSEPRSHLSQGMGTKIPQAFVAPSKNKLKKSRLIIVYLEAHFVAF